MSNWIEMNLGIMLKFFFCWVSITIPQVGFVRYIFSLVFLFN
jgi:hypothetical protein